MRNACCVLLLAVAWSVSSFADQTTPIQLGMVKHTSGSSAEGTGVLLCTAPMVPPVNGTMPELDWWVESAVGNVHGQVYTGTIVGGPVTLVAYTASTSLGSGTGNISAPFTGGSGVSAGILAMTAGTVYFPCYQLDNASAVISNPDRGYNGVKRWYQTGTTYGSPPATLTSTGNQTAFGWYSQWGPFTPAAGTSTCGWPAPLDTWFGGNVANIVGYQKCVAPVTGNITVLGMFMDAWSGSTPTFNMAVYLMDNGVAEGCAGCAQPDHGPGTVVCQGTPTTLTQAPGWLFFTISGGCPVTAGQSYWLAANNDVDNTNSGQCLSGCPSTPPDPTLGGSYYLFTGSGFSGGPTYPCCTYANLTPTQVGDVSNNGHYWLANVGYVAASLTAPTQIGAFAVGP